MSQENKASRKNLFLPAVEDFFDDATPQGQVQEMKENVPIIIGMFRDAYTNAYLAANPGATADDAWRSWQSDIHGTSCVVEPETQGLFAKALGDLSIDNPAIQTIAEKLELSPERVVSNLTEGRQVVNAGMEVYAEQASGASLDSLDLTGLTALLSSGLGFSGEIESERL